MFIGRLHAKRKPRYPRDGQQTLPSDMADSTREGQRFPPAPAYFRSGISRSRRQRRSGILVFPVVVLRTPRLDRKHAEANEPKAENKPNLSKKLGPAMHRLEHLPLRRRVA